MDAKEEKFTRHLNDKIFTLHGKMTVVEGLNCYVCSYSLTAEGEIGTSCRDDPPATGKLYTCPSDDDVCALRVSKINGHLTELRRYCSMNCISADEECNEEDYQTDFDTMHDGICYRCCEEHGCNGRWADTASSVSAAKLVILISVTMATFLS
ncbi:uncharacterized protein LOC144342254 [Saccoglossus kowalevskii]